MERFSDRIGITSRPVLGLDEAPYKLRVSLWNVVQPLLFKPSKASTYAWMENVQRLYEFLHLPTNRVNYHQHVEIKRLEEYFFANDLPWYEALNFIDFAAQTMWKGGMLATVCAGLDKVFEREGSPYRYIGGVLTPVADPVELEELLKANTQPDRFSGARQHVVTALQFLGLKPEPDYRNAITEAISAVESTLKVLTTEKHLDLSGALKEFVKAHPIHGALVRGLDALYGYTSNEHGLRHALLEADAKVGFAEAKFMIVACAAFMNYLILKSA
jgi:AbiJ N-terminal domain 4